MSFFKSLLKFFLKTDEALVYTAFNNEDYFKTIAKLKNHGIKYTIKNLSRHSDTPTPLLVTNDRKSPAHYEIYVKKEYLNDATRVINQN